MDSPDLEKTPDRFLIISVEESDSTIGFYDSETYAEVARIEGLFADPEFFRKNAAKVNGLTVELDAAKANVTKLYARWEELEAIKAAAMQSPS